MSPSFSQFQEDYALNPDKRAQLVQGTTPGTEEHYLYRLRFLSQQLQSGEVPLTAHSIEEALKIIQDAAKSNTISADGSQVLRQLKTQIALLAFTVKPELLLKELNHGPVVIASARAGATGGSGGEDEGLEIVEAGDESSSPTVTSTTSPPLTGFGIESLSSTLNEELVSTKALTEKLLKSFKTDFYQTTVTSDNWPYLLTFPEMESIIDQLDTTQLESLFRTMDVQYSPRSLEILGGADASQYDQVIVKIVLRLYEGSRVFFSDAILKDLTRAQLESIRTKNPQVMNNEPFVALLEKRIFPALFAENKEAAYKDWLDRMVEFVDTLSIKFNHHKLSVYLLSLQYDLKKGASKDKDKFLKYLAIPRYLDYYSNDRRQAIDADSVVSFLYSDSFSFWSERVKPATSELDIEVTNEYLSEFMRESKSIAEFESYFSISYLEPLLAQTMLMSGDSDIARWAAMLHEREGLAKISEKIILEFGRDNKSTYLPTDNVVLSLKVKNVKRVLVRVFEVKTFEYLQEHEHAVVGLDLNLDGLTPNWEHQITVSEPPLVLTNVKIELQELANRRGAFIVDVISNGENCAAYFTKGCLDFVERQSVAGHVLTIIDEDRKKLTHKTGVWLQGHYYYPNGDGDIIVPYGSSTSSSNNDIYLIHDGFSTRLPFNHRKESYALRLACHIDSESLVSGATAKILFKPTVHIYGNPVLCPAGLLEHVVLTIESNDLNGILTTTTVPDFKIHDVNWSEYNFQVPENMAALKVTLALKIKVITTGKYQDLADSREFQTSSPLTDQTVTFQCNGQCSTERVPGEILTLLRNTSQGYKVLVLGKNGEKRTNVPLAFQVEHPLWKDHIGFHLKSDEAGEVHLGRLEDANVLCCNTTNLSWELSGRDHHVYPQKIHSVAGEPVVLPLTGKDLGTIRKVSLFSLSGRTEDIGRDSCVVDDLTHHIKLEDGALVIQGLKSGVYRFRIGDDVKLCIHVASAKATQSKIPGLENFLLGTNPMMELMESATAPLYMSTPVSHSDSRQVEIQLYNWTPETRVNVIATRFVPYGQTSFEELSVLDPENPWTAEKAELTNAAFKSGRVLGEEYQYILNRKAQTKHWAGNLLTKPSVLLAPWAVADTTMATQTMEASKEVDTVITNELGRMKKKSLARRTNGGSAYYTSMRMLSNLEYSNAPPLLNFLVKSASTLINLVPDPDTGLVKIPYSALKEGSFLEIFASDEHQASQQSFTVLDLADNLHMEKKDLRFKSSMDPKKHYIGERTGVDLDPAQSFSTSAPSITLHSTAGSASEVRVINSVSQVYDLMLTLLKEERDKATLRKFGFIVDWNRYSDETKKEKFSKWCCHELNLFLHKKDKPFFLAVVRPFLKNKVLKSFIDDYLTEAPLEKYTSLKEFSLLTCLEKCLLAERVPSVRSAVRQWIKDRICGTKDASDVQLFQTVMGSNKMEEVPNAIDESQMMHYTMHLQSAASAPLPEEDEEFVCVSEEDALVAPSSLMSAPTARPRAQPTLAALTDRTTELEGKRLNLTELRRVRADRGSEMRDRERVAKAMENRFKPVDLTKEMAETYYYERQDVSLVVGTQNNQPNSFWLDLVQWQDTPESFFLSHNFIANAGSFTDALATLALLDVTFKPQETSMSRSADQALIISSRSPAVIFHSSIKELASVPLSGSVLVTQQYYSADERTEYDEKLMATVRRYISAKSEFRPLESYGAHVVVMNASPNPMRVHLEVQIPHGSISVNGSLKSGQDVQLGPHKTFEYEYGFYFPEQGEFAHYPAHVSNDKDIIAFAAPSVLKVCAPQLDQKSTDTTSWTHILKRGSEDEILTKLSASPVSSLLVDLLVPRLKRQKRFLHQVTSVLRNRQEYVDQVWQESLLSSTDPRSALENLDLVREYLQNLQMPPVADWFTSKVLTCRPHSRLDYSWSTSFQYLEYFPLINARAHKATRTSTILNDRFKTQYDRLLKLLSEKPHLEADDLLILIIYLLAQDRVLEAKDKFVQLTSIVSLSAPETNLFRLQYDYLRAYLSLCVEVQIDSSASEWSLDFVGVKKVLEKYQAHPIERWNKMFKDMQEYVNEIQKSLTETSNTATETPSVSPESSSPVEADQEFGAALAAENEEESGSNMSSTADFKIGNNNILLVRHRAVKEVTVEYYSIDAETMFSASPMVFSDQGENESGSASGDSGSKSGSASYRLLKPNGVDSHLVKKTTHADSIMMIPILSQYLNSNVMISIKTSPPTPRVWRAYYSQTILVQCLEQSGLLKVLSKIEGRPVRGSYVKVYAELKSGGEPVFWKDGYTDLVGRFAYAQVSTGAASDSGSGNAAGLGGVKRFAVFVDAGREGCTVKTLPVPPV
ncbi:hypothetical protein EMPS_01758 [Entomortierella parvispora]|uniref:Uncharacterized protein n=1 Tax=Entomortierella parvispora TaxID=205924 RepID=A0A9P3LT37_9FUNG|nr:hypothetical protein EMPS_01758 [Entomortierella parvispora]